MTPIQQSVDKLFKLRAERLAAQKVVDAMKVEEDELNRVLLDYALEADDDDLMGTTHYFHVIHKEEPEVINWAALQEHIRTTGELDLLEKRPMKSAIKQRWEAGNEVPGVQRFLTASATLRAIK